MCLSIAKSWVKTLIGKGNKIFQQRFHWQMSWNFAIKRILLPASIGFANLTLLAWGRIFDRWVLLSSGRQSKIARYQVKKSQVKFIRSKHRTCFSPIIRGGWYKSLQTLRYINRTKLNGSINQSMKSVIYIGHIASNLVKYRWALSCLLILIPQSRSAYQKHAWASIREFSNIASNKPGVDPGYLERGFRCVGGRFADFISFFFDIPMKMK